MGTNNLNTEFALTMNNISVNLGGVDILEDVNAGIEDGGCTAVIGPNGAGKTTLLLAILGHVQSTGSIQFKSGKPPRIGYVPQSLSFDRGLPLTVLEFMVMGIQRIPLWLWIKSDNKDTAYALLKSVGADSLAKRRLGALSGGEIQRVLLALALQQKPELLVLDEPAAGVDLSGEKMFCELLEELRISQKFSQIMVSHDLGTVTHHATHVICLNKRVIAQGAPEEVLTSENLTALFGMHMGLVDAKVMPEGHTSCTAECCEKGKEIQSEGLYPSP